MKKIKMKDCAGSLAFFIPCLLLYIYAAKTDFRSLLLLLAISGLFALMELHLRYQNKAKRRLQSQEKLQTAQILNHIPLPLFIVDGQYHLSFLNTAALALFHCKSSMVGRPCCDLNTAICHTEECAIGKMERTGNGRTYYNMDGKRFMVSTALIENKVKTDRKYIEIIQDITEVTETEKILEEKTVELETMSENLLGGVLITAMTEGFPVIRCNQGYRDIVRKKDAQIVGQCAMQWVIPEDAASLTQKIREQLLVGNSVSIEHRIHCKGNTALWISLRGKRTMLRDEEVGVWILTDISNAKESELALRVDEERYRIAMQSIEDIVIDYDMKTHVMYHSSKAKEIYGVPEIVENMPQSILDSGTVLEESRTEYLNLFSELSNGEKKCSCVLRARAADGRILWNRLTFTAIFDDDGNTVRAIGILQDITREKNVEMQYKREARYLALNGKDGTFYYEADITHRCFISGHETIVNAYSGTATNDFDTVLELLIEHMVYAPDRALVREQISYATIMSDYQAKKTNRNVEYRRDMNGEIMWSSCSIQSFFDEDSNCLHCVGCIKNIDEMKRKELSLQKKAERDLLTGLYNKVTTEMLIKCAMHAAEGKKTEGAFLLLDLDNFKNVNDTLGHAFGDAVLTEVSHGLLSLFQKDDIVGRIGGDEFVVYINQADNETTIKKANQICEMFHRMYTGMNSNYKISGTIGISLFPVHGTSFDALYKSADCAMYYAKERGKDSYAVFDEALPSTDSTHESSHRSNENVRKLRAENISEYVLHTLYESDDSSRAICTILELLSKYFHFDRGYILEADGADWRCTQEWHAGEAVSSVSELLKFPWDVLRENGQNFNKNGVFTVNCCEKNDEKVKSFLATQGVGSLMWFSVTNNGILQAVIGFDNALDTQRQTQEELSELHQISILIGIFLMNSRSKENFDNPSIVAKHVMDSIENIIYVVDPNDFSLYYLNRRTQMNRPDAHLGAKCYESICGRDLPCEDCVLCQFLRENKERLCKKIFDKRYEAWLSVTVSKIIWQDGKEYCLVECIRI